MLAKYRFQFPIGLQLYKWGMSLWIQKPIVKRYIRPPIDTEEGGSISVWLNIYDEES